MRNQFRGLALCAIALAGLVGISASATASPDDEKCTDQINYAGDPRSNAEINSIGASTGHCPPPLTSGAALPPGLGAK